MGRLVPSLALLLWLTGLAAASPSDTEEAKQHYARGTAHYNLREYKEAVTEFEAAYRLAPDPVFLYNLGQCNRLMGNNEEALHFYRSYLRMQPDSPNRAEVEGRIEKLEAEIAAHPRPVAPPASAAPPLTPPPAVTTPTPAATSAVAVRAIGGSSPHERARPVYKKWWFWTVIGVAAAGAATGLALGLTSETSPRSYPQVNF
jgi:tetratricopeptide (TPR) repeat protein